MIGTSALWVTVLALGGGAWQDSIRPPAALDRADLEAWLDGLLPGELQQGQIPGAIVVVVKDGAVLLSKGYGLSDVAAGRPMDPDRTVVGVGSVSKLFTWTAVMQMVEQGKLDLDRDVREYLDFPISDSFEQPITLRHLMTHTAGFAARGFRQYPSPRALGPHLRATPAPPRIFPPGQIAAYSNYGSMLAGYLVERVSGEPFVEYVDRHVLAPLEMHRSTFRRPIPAALRADLASSYDLATSPPEPPNEEEPAGDPSGHLVTTGTDLAHFMVAQLGRGRFGGSAVLAATTVGQMQTVTFTSVPGGQGTGLGLFRLDYNGHRILWHGGDIEGFHAGLHLLPDDSVGFFVLFNGTGLRRGILGAAHHLRSALFHRFMDRYYPGSSAVDEPTLPTAAPHGRLVAGEYTLSARPAGDYQDALFLLQRYGLGLRIKAAADGTIETPGFLSFDDGQSKRWREVAPFVWRQVGGQARLRFDIEGGRVRGAWPDDLPSIYVLQPVSPANSAAVQVPIVVLATIVIYLTVIVWPIAAFRERRASRTGTGKPADRTGRSALRTASAIAAVFLLGWLAVIAADLSSRPGTDGWIRLVQVVGVGFVVATAIALRRLWTTWRSTRSRIRITDTVVALALLELIWFSFAFHLLSISLNY